MTIADAPVPAAADIIDSFNSINSVYYQCL